MIRFLLPIMTLCLTGFIPVTAQMEVESGPTAPIEWKRYKDLALNVSASMPKPPIKLVSTDVCSETERHSFYAYARNSVYELTLVKETAKNAPDKCETRSRFQASAMFDELVRIADATPSKVQDERTEFRKSHPLGNVLIVLDSKRQVVLELRVHSHFPDRSETDPFFLSLDTRGTKKADAFVGELNQIIGDEKDENSDEKGATPSESSANYRVVYHPRSAYTEAAREANITGTVRLKMILHANGTVGTVTPVTALPYGLTEQAVIAAKKTIFLPKVNSGKAVSIIITRDYTFTIY